MPELTPEQARLAEAHTLELLNSIPTARCNPFGSYHQLLKEISAIERTLKLLNAFVRFMTALNPVQYLEWMHKAFSNFTQTKVTEPPVEVAVVEQTSPSAPLPIPQPSAEPLPISKPTLGG